MISKRKAVARRRPVTRRRRTLLVFEVLLFGAVMTAFGYFFMRYAKGSVDFRVKKVAIHGLGHLDEKTVLAASGITPDGNVFAFHEADVTARIKALPYVEDCTVSRVFPDTVSITVHERVPAASLHVGRHAFEIDRKGVVLREYAANEMPMDPFITQAPGVEFAKPGDQLNEPALQSALAIWDRVNAGALKKDLRVSELAALRGDDVRMYCAGVNYEIRWGNEDVDAMAQRLEVLWNKFDGALPCTEYVDLRFGADVACK